MRMPCLIVLCLLLLVSCGRPAAEETSSKHMIDGNAIKAHIQKLASDEMEGRVPAGKGGQLATAYIADFFKSIGLKTSFQAVPLIGITSTVSPMKLTGRG